ncbi:MAG: DUF2905 domain-containing protein [Elusimicrobia bacterium]|nr:DUF2905 domain-containing protein [Elusimicrobiota bacterium]
MIPVGKSLILLGVCLAAAGAILLAADKIPFLGRLPGDFHLRRGHLTLHFPLASCLLVSVVLSLLWALVRRR